MSENDQPRWDPVTGGHHRCPGCQRVLPLDQFGWRDAAHTIRQSRCRDCMRTAAQESRKRPRPPKFDHLRNHYEIGLTLCGLNADSAQVDSHFYDEDPIPDLPACVDCVAIDEAACLEADAAQHEPRSTFAPNPYRMTYLAVVDRMTRSVTR